MGDVMPTILDIYGVKPRCSSTQEPLGGGGRDEEG